MAIEMPEQPRMPRVEPMPPVRYDLYVSDEDRVPIDEMEWTAKASTLDEAAELATSLGKRYFVTIRSVEG